jgi:hypothetical protein
MSWKEQSVPPGRRLATFPGTPDDVKTWPLDWPFEWRSIEITGTPPEDYERWLCADGTCLEISVNCPPPFKLTEGELLQSRPEWSVRKISPPVGDPFCRLVGTVQVAEKWNGFPNPCGVNGYYKSHNSVFLWYADIIDQELQGVVVEFVCGEKTDVEIIDGQCLGTLEAGNFTGTPDVQLSIVP